MTTTTKRADALQVGDTIVGRWHRRVLAVASRLHSRKILVEYDYICPTAIDAGRGRKNEFIYYPPGQGLFMPDAILEVLTP
jgi:hypothetical protein